jgi:hypothetical protein
VTFSTEPSPVKNGAMLQFERYTEPSAPAANPPGHERLGVTTVGDELPAGTRTSSPVPGAALSRPSVENSTA